MLTSGRLTSHISAVEETEKACNYGPLAVRSTKPTSVQILTFLTQHREKL